MIKVVNKLGTIMGIFNNVFKATVFFMFVCKTLNATPSVIIIGAGPSGIAAATRLLENNITNVTVLEAENRIGGRVFSVQFGDAIVDLGAEWCHGEKNNIVYEMVKDLHILKSDTFNNFKFYYSNRDTIDQDFSNKIFSIIEDIYSPDGLRKVNESTTVGDFCANMFLAKTAELNLKDPKQIEFTRDVLAYFERYVISSEGAFSWYDPSAESDYRECEGDLTLSWNGNGFKTVLDIMMGKHTNNSKPAPIDEKILLNREVSKIIWDHTGANTVTVQCSDGSQFVADHVIFTPSLGVLKESHQNLFQPALPEDKKYAIENIGIGAVAKVMFHFPKRWWATETGGNFNFVWNSNDRYSPKYPDLHEFYEREGVELHDLFAIISVKNNPNVLSAWFSGSTIPYIDKLGDEQLINGTMLILNRFLGHKYDITPPDSAIRNTWYANPHFRGTYSYQTVASRKRNGNINLQRPLNNSQGDLSLLFAGEATHEHYYSTVHGAIESGYREAERIIEYFNVLHK